MVKIQQKSNGQYVVTIPKGIGDALDLAGVEASWSIESGNRLSLTIENND